MRTKTPKRKNKVLEDLWKILRLLVLIAVLVCVRYAFQMPAFSFGAVDIRPVPTNISRADILTVAGISEPANLFTLDKKEVERKLTGDLRIKKASLGYQFPATVVIYVDENKPLAYVKSPYAFFEVDYDGKILSVGKGIRQASIPIISGIDEDAAFVGDTVVSPIIKDIMGFLQLLSESNRSIISEIHVNADSVKIMTLNKLKVHLGKPEKIQDKAEVFDLVMQKIKQQNLVVEYIDLSYARPFIKIK